MDETALNPNLLKKLDVIDYMITSQSESFEFIDHLAWIFHNYNFTFDNINEDRVIKRLCEYLSYRANHLTQCTLDSEHILSSRSHKRSNNQLEDSVKALIEENNENLADQKFCKGIVIQNNIVYNLNNWATLIYTNAASKGKWYFEVVVLESLETDFLKYPKPSFRVGWSTRYHKAYLPLGTTEFSFGIESTRGHFCCNQSMYPFYPKNLKVGDSIGCYISLKSSQIPESIKQFNKSCSNFHEKQSEYTTESKGPNHNFKRSCDSYVQYTVNGIPTGKFAVKDLESYILQDEYHPAVSIYGGSCIQINIGPYFNYPPIYSKQPHLTCNKLPLPQFTIPDDTLKISIKQDEK